MKTRTAKIIPNGNGYCTDDYDDEDINIANITRVGKIYERMRTYYIKLPCFDVSFSNDGFRTLYFLNMEDAIKERQKISEAIQRYEERIPIEV